MDKAWRKPGHRLVFPAFFCGGSSDGVCPVSCVAFGPSLRLQEGEGSYDHSFILYEACSDRKCVAYGIGSGPELGWVHMWSGCHDPS